MRRGCPKVPCICGLTFTPDAFNVDISLLSGPIDSSDLERILAHTARQLTQQPLVKGNLKGRRVIVVDGTGVSMPDTQSNQGQWPQQKSQDAGFLKQEFAAVLIYTTVVCLAIGLVTANSRN